MAIDTQEVLTVLEQAKPEMALLGPVAGTLAVAGIELVELVVTFVDAENHQRAIDTMKQWLRSGAHGTVQAFLDTEFPDG